jgi:hypothetical protein
LERIGGLGADASRRAGFADFARLDIRRRFVGFRELRFAIARRFFPWQSVKLIKALIRGKSRTLDGPKGHCYNKRLVSGKQDDRVCREAARSASAPLLLDHEKR